MFLYALLFYFGTLLALLAFLAGAAKINAGRARAMRTQAPRCDHREAA